MKETKHNTIPFEETIEVGAVIGKKVLTDDGKKIGKVKSLHIHQSDLSVEGVLVDPGMFEPVQYIDKGYIKSITTEGVILKVTPVTDFIDKLVYDSTGKKIGKVIVINRGKKTNTLLSITVKRNDKGDDQIIMADYISVVGEAVMLKEPIED